LRSSEKGRDTVGPRNFLNQETVITTTLCGGAPGDGWRMKVVGNTISYKQSPELESKVRSGGRTN